MILTDAGEVVGGTKNWSSGFLPASYQGTLFRREGAPILDLAPPQTIGDEQQRGRLDLLNSLNRHYGDAQAGRHGTGSAAAILRAGVPDAGRGARSRGPDEGNRGHAQAVRDGQRGHGEVRLELPAGAAAGGARRAIHRALLGQRQRMGRAHRSRQESRTPLPGDGCADRRAADGSQSARPAG